MNMNVAVTFDLLSLLFAGFNDVVFSVSVYSTRIVAKPNAS